MVPVIKESADVGNLTARYEWNATYFPNVRKHVVLSKVDMQASHSIISV